MTADGDIKSSFGASRARASFAPYGRGPSPSHPFQGNGAVFPEGFRDLALGGNRSARARSRAVRRNERAPWPLSPG